MGFRKFSGLDPQVLGIDPNDPDQWAQLMDLFDKCRQHSQRSPTPAQTSLHLQYYRQGLKSPSDLNQMAAVVYLNDLFNPTGDTSTLKTLQQQAQIDPDRILKEKESVLASRMIHFLPQSTLESFRNDFFQRLIGWSLEQKQTESTATRLAAFQHWAYQYDSLWILYRGKPLMSFIKDLPSRVRDLISQIQPNELRQESSDPIQITDPDQKDYLNSIPEQLWEDSDYKLALKLQACCTLGNQTAWDENQCCQVLDSCQPSTSALKSASKEVPAWMNRVIRSATK